MHGCATELQQLLVAAAPNRVILVGDLFTKGPDPAGVFRLVREHEAVLGNHDDRLLKHLDGAHDAHAQAVLQALPSAAKNWLRRLPLRIELPEHTVVHAGLDPAHPRRTTRRQATTMRRFPDAAGQYWWQQYHQKRGVVFGHDARRGLIRVERQGQPYLIGLDTGCVYGGSLTGWLLEDDRYVQVPAQQVWAAVS